MPELVWTLCTCCMLFVLLSLACVALLEDAEHIDWIFLKQKNPVIKRRKHDSIWRDIVKPSMTIDFKFQLLPRTEEFEISSTVRFNHCGHRCWFLKVRWQTTLCMTGTITRQAVYTGCNRRNGPDFGRVFLRSNYTDITQNTYIQSSVVTEILAREVWNIDGYYSLIDYQIHIETGRNMWFL